MDTKSILLVDDDPEVLEPLETEMRKLGYEVTIATDPRSAIDSFRQEVPDLLVLDISLDSGAVVPGYPADGIEVLKRIRNDSDVPVIMLTRTSIQSVKLLAFQLGADDYVTKPFDPSEVLARAEAILRRGASFKTTTRTFLDGRLKIAPEARRVDKEGEEIGLTRTEYDLLESLAQAGGRVLSRQQLLEKIRSFDYYGDERTIDVHIRHLREKIEDEPSKPQIVLTVRGVGYRFGLEPD